MGIKLLNATYVEMKLILRNIIFLIFFVVGILQTAYIMDGRMNGYDIGGALTATGAIVQGGLFAFVIFGYFLSRQEEYFNCDEVFYSLQNGMYIKILSKIIALSWLSLLFSGAIYIVQALLLLKIQAPIILYFETMKYIALYYFFPFFVIGVAGLVSGKLISNKFVYFVIVAIPVFFGPLSIMILRNITSVA